MNELLLALLNLPPEGSTMAGEIDALHFFVVSVTMASSTFVGVVAAWFIIRYRHRTHDQLTPHLVATIKNEWAIIVGILILFVSWWVIGYHQYVRLYDPPADAMPVYVSAKQWMWEFTYADGRSSEDTLTVPVGKPVKLVMTSRDVIHSFYVPAFRLKHDVIPGRYVSIWFEAKTPGTYPIFCAEYCGVSHSRMRGEVVALSPEDYDKWLHDKGRDASGSSQLAAMGARIAERRECLACHTLNGQPHVGPTWARLYGSTVVLADGRRVVADEEYLTKSMMEPQADIVAGYRTVMPTYAGTLSATETAALVELIRSLRDHPIPAGVTLPPILVSPTAPQNEDDGGARVPQ